MQIAVRLGLRTFFATGTPLIFGCSYHKDETLNAVTASNTRHLDAFDELSADELGTWVHRLYQVYLMQPRLLSESLPQKQSDTERDLLLRAVTEHSLSDLGRAEN